jgi:hypothetical protein
MRMNRAAALLVVAVVTATASGCGSGAESTPRTVGSAFADAVSGKDATRACSLLAPQTRAELEKSAGKPCASAILDEGLPSAGAWENVESFGTMAQVKFAADVMFVAEFKTGWKIMAAGCAPVPGHPYDCQLQGG